LTSLVSTAQKRYPEITITQKGVYELKHKETSFDIVFFLEILEHLDHPDKALKEIRRVLKDDDRCRPIKQLI